MKLKIPRQPTAVAGAVLVILGLLFAILYLDEKTHHIDDFDINSESELVDEELDTGKAVEQYNRWTLSENRRIFHWHARSTKILFWVSILITITGMAFAFWQFVEASHSELEATRADELQVKSQFVSLAFKSRSLATFMMFVSLAYLLIYVTMVYPVKPVQNDNAAPESPTFIADPDGAIFEPDDSLPDEEEPGQGSGVKVKEDP